MVFFSTVKFLCVYHFFNQEKMAAMKSKDTYSLEVMTNLDSIFKSRDFILSTNVRLVKAMVFPVVMYGCEIGL